MSKSFFLSLCFTCFSWHSWSFCSCVHSFLCRLVLSVCLVLTCLLVVDHLGFLIPFVSLVVRIDSVALVILVILVLLVPLDVLVTLIILVDLLVFLVYFLLQSGVCVFGLIRNASVCNCPVIKLDSSQTHTFY